MPERGEFIRFGKEGHSLLRLDEEANLIEQIEIDIPAFGNTFMLEPAIHPSGTHFIPFERGEIYTRSLENIGALGDQKWTHVSFAKDGTKLYAVPFYGYRYIHIFNFPELTLQKIETVAYKAIGFLHTDDAIKVIGHTYEFGNNGTFIKTLEL